MLSQLSQPNDGRLHIFTPVWGSHFTSLLENALGVCFQWPENAKAIKNSIWTLQIDAENSPAIQIARKLIPTAEIRTIITPRIAEQGQPIGALKMQGLLKVIKQCLAERSRMLMATPDFIFGPDTIPNMLKVTQEPRTCVSIAHLRVLPKVLNALKEFPDGPTNPFLMQLGINSAHPSWDVCESGLDPNGIYRSGVCWRRLTPNLISIQHQMVSPFLVNFVQSDLVGFETWKGMTPPAFGEWDHNWPTDLIDQERLRYIGSSDAACMLEVTEATANMPPLEPRRQPSDQFFLQNHHNQIQRQFLSILRHA